VALTAATLAACAQSPFVADRSASLTSRQAASEADLQAPLVASRRKLVTTRKRTVLATRKPTADTRDAAHGLASYYRHGTKTASGEKFDASELTAAHRTLPFGTRLRVTNVATGQSVMVRVNDRGPFIPGRVVDVSHAAADAIGLTERGVTKVKLDVVQE
jgi:rare lipoprotein A